MGVAAAVKCGVTQGAGPTPMPKPACTPMAVGAGMLGIMRWGVVEPRPLPPPPLLVGRLGGVGEEWKKTVSESMRAMFSVAGPPLPGCRLGAFFCML